jgi:prepilin signal peptidase PulO-like enzyme (type II secretory pathway)
VALAGVIAGALANLAIYRWGERPRPIGPWSRRHPDAPRRRPWDFVPLAGWLFLRRESSLHGRGYWLRPLLVELIVPALWAGLYWWEVDRHALLRPPLPPGVGLAPAILTVLHAQFALHAVLVALLVVATCIDLDDLLVPDVITVPGTLLALLAAALYPWALLPDTPWARIRAQAVNWPEIRGLPDPNPGIQLVELPEQVNFLRLTAPNLWPDELDGLRGNMPLVAGLACYLLWCFALLPRRWRTRRGFETAVSLFVARIVRDPYSWLIALMAAAGSAWIWLIYRLGSPHWAGLLSALVGMASCGVILWGIRVIGSLVLRREAMGFGDVTLMFMLGAFLGWQPGVLLLMPASLFGVIIGLLAVVLRRQTAIPFGPSLCLGAVTVLVLWAEVWERTWHLFEAAAWLAPTLLVACGVALTVLLLIVQGVKAMFRREGEPPPEPVAAAAPAPSPPAEDAPAATER